MGFACIYASGLYRDKTVEREARAVTGTFVRLRGEFLIPNFDCVWILEYSHFHQILDR
jgi:hypothetical protein